MSEEKDLYGQFKIKEYTHFGLFIHESQAYLGRAVVWLSREGGMQRLSSIKEAEREELFSVIMPEYEKVLEKLWKPDHMNYCWLGNHFHTHEGHGHMHLIPRYESSREFEGYTFTDTRWGKNYSPSPDSDVPKEIVLKIKEAIQEVI